MKQALTDREKYDSIMSCHTVISLVSDGKGV